MCGKRNEPAPAASMTSERSSRILMDNLVSHWSQTEAWMISKIYPKSSRAFPNDSSEGTVGEKWA